MDNIKMRREKPLCYLFTLLHRFRNDKNSQAVILHTYIEEYGELKFESEQTMKTLEDLMA